MRLRRHSRQQCLFASLFLSIVSAFGQAAFEQLQHHATISARQAAVTTQAVLPFYFGPPSLGDPFIDLGTLFVASVVEANETYTAIAMGCQPANGIAEGYECDLHGIAFMATQISSATYIHSWVSSGAGYPGGGDATSIQEVNDVCVFLDGSSTSASCTAFKTATAALVGGKVVTYPLESQPYTIAGTGWTMDNIPITAGAEKLPSIPTPTGASKTGDGGGTAATSASSTAKPKKNAAAVVKKDTVLEGGSTFGLVVGILAWALI